MAYRLDLGPWGVELDDADFGRALCALGVAAVDMPRRPRLEAIAETAADPGALGERLRAGDPVRWAIDPVLAAPPARWAAVAARFPAAAAARAWEAAVGREPAEPRLAVTPFADQLGPLRWLLDQLLQPGVGATPSIAVPGLAGRPTWQWPMRVGLLDHPGTHELAASLRPEGWPGGHHRIVAPEHEPADLVLLPQTLPEAVARLAGLHQPIDAGCVVVLGGLAGATDLGLGSVLGALRLRARPWGLAVVDVSPGLLDAWLAELLGRLARDATLDVALRSVLGPGGRWLLLADPDALAGARLSRVAARAAAVLVERPWRMAMLPRTVPEALGLDLGAGGVELEMAVADEARYVDDDTGSVAVAEIADAAARADRERPAMAQPRWIQVEIRGGPGLKGRPQRRRLAPDTPYGVDVWIGPEPGGLRAEEVFPDHELPRDGRTHRLTVVFAELGGSMRTTTARVLLPPTGAGTRHRFHIRTGSGGEFRARIIVAYRNRVLQTAVLQAPVRASARGRRDHIGLAIEAAVRPGLAELAGRQRFGAAIVHNHAEDGSPSATLMQDAQAVPLDLGGIEGAVRQITADLTGAALDPASYGPTLEAEGTVRLLFRLANQGVLLRDDLFSRAAFKELAGNAERIQVVAADPNAVLPLEYVYDLPVPIAPPTLCPNARQALLDGRCPPENHPRDANDHTDVVCPSGFWAMSRVIERHVADPEGVRRTGSAFAVDADPVGNRNVLSGLRSAVFAASARMDQVVAGSSAKVEAALTSATAGGARRVRSWDEWAADVGGRSPSLLVLLAHSARDDLTGLGALEIEEDQRIPASQINARYVGPEGSHPIVLLLGCDTAVPELQYQTFVARFRTGNAALVVGTVATVAGSHAAGVAASLAQALHDLDTTREPTFGDLLREARRRLLADGEVMALSLVSYGDADWRFPAGATADAAAGGDR